MRARVHRLYPTTPPPRFIDWTAAPAGELSVFWVAGERRASLSTNPSSPRHVIPELRDAELESLTGSSIRLKGHEHVTGGAREVVWLCDISQA